MDKLYVYILPEHVYSKIDETAIQSYNNEPPVGNPIVGSGPYLVAERQVGQFTRLVANPNLLQRQSPPSTRSSSSSTPTRTRSARR